MSSRFVGRRPSRWLCWAVLRMPRCSPSGCFASTAFTAAGRPADPLALGCAAVSPLGFLMCYLVLPLSLPCQFFAVAVELELLGGSSCLFPSFLFIATHHLGVTLRCRVGVRAEGLLQPRCQPAAEA